MSRSDTPSPIPLAALSLLACTLAAMASYGHAAERDKYVGREVPARRLSEPPVIDGDLSDPAWEEAAIADTFIDSLTAEPVADQTRVWMGYDSQAIYLAAYCWDPEPDKLVIRETKRDADINDDDHFAFVLDAFHTHDWNDTAIFRVTARGTQSSEIRRGRGGKTEWKGDWRAATRIADDGYTMEMVVPWRILSYPNRDGPTTLGFDVSRKHGRYQRGSGLSDLTQAWLWQNAAHWVGIELPQHGFDQEILILPFLAAGRAKRDDEWTETARGGLDVRYRPTPTLTGVLTLNPDFRNVQSEVEGIDFSRGERWVGESRPFFQEGHRMFQTSSGVGDYFVQPPYRAHRPWRQAVRPTGQAHPPRAPRHLRLR